MIEDTVLGGVAMFCLVVPLVLFSAATPVPVVNGGFDEGLSGWSVTPQNLGAAPAKADDRTVARIEVPEGTPPSYPNLYQTLNVQPGDLLTVQADAKGESVQGGYGVYLAVEFRDAQGQRISYSQSGPASTDGAWTTLHVQTVVPPDAAETRLCLLLNGTGAADFDSVKVSRQPNVVATKAPDGPITITATDEIACPSLIGFGAEDDGWFYNPENAEHGVTEADARLREDRITWMDPDWVRMFFWYKDWNPSGDWQTFDFDSPNMASHYRTLDLYQRIGATVNVVGVEWGVNDPYGSPEKAAKAIGALLEHLIKAKGYTCIGAWTLTNEPNGYFIQSGYDFERFTEMYRLVRKEVLARGLQVRMVGSDETNGGFPFFQQCVSDDRYFNVADYFASHHYFQYADRVTAPGFFDERLDLLASHSPLKQLVIAEFGFQDSRSGTMENPIMETYPYAVWTSAFVIEGLNRGIAGFSIWCLHEVYYPGGGLMNYGLWDYKDNDWKPRPVYHAWASFTRLTEPGQRVQRCTSSSPAHVIATVAGDTLFWVNQSEFPAQVVLKGATVSEVRVMTEKTLSGDRECGTLVPVKDARFEAPAMSFGYAEEVEELPGRS